MYGNLVNKNARAALKEYGDHNGASVDFDIIPSTSAENTQFIAKAIVGERQFSPATASSKKDAKENAADLALRAIFQEPYSRFRKPLGTPESTELGSSDQVGSSFTLRRSPRKRRAKAKNLVPSAPPDKDPVMLLNEYGQKRGQVVNFEDVHCTYPGLYSAQVTIGDKMFGPKRNSSKKMARKLAAIVALKELMNWEPSEGMFDMTEDSPHWSVARNSGSEIPHSQGEVVQNQAILLHKDPVMLLNEHCQKNQMKIAYDDFPHVGPDHKKTFTCQVVVGETRFEEGSGASKSLAKRNAAMHALKGLFQMNVEMSLKPGSTNKEEIDVSRHPVSILYEYGQKKGLKIEFEDLGHSGPDHFKVFNFRAKVGDSVCDKGSGRSKKDARKEAAAIALQSLGFQVSPELITPQPTTGQALPQENEVPKASLTDGKNAVCALYELCQAYRLPQPEVLDVQPEEYSDPSLFYSAFKVGDQQFEHGAGRSKKTSKEAAAQHALAELSKINGALQYKTSASTEGDKFAALVWNHLLALTRDAPEGWRFAGYKIVAAFIMQDGEDDPGSIVSLATGNKCISGDSLRMDGTRVNDSHAEVVARRGLIRFFHYHIAILLNGSADEKSIFVQKERQGKIQLRDGVKFHLYVSTAPCGDAAVFVNESSTSHNNASETKAFFGSRHHGLLRTKVEKGEGTIPLDAKDGILTIDGIRNGQRLRTASCSDKIAKWNVLGVQGTLLSVLIEPVYISSVILGKLYDPAHLSRAVSMRVERDNDNSFSNQLPDSFHVNHPQLERGSLFEQGQCREIETKCKTNVLSLNWCVSVDTSVEIFDGCLGTFPNYHLAKPPRVSRQALFASLKEVIKSSQNLEHRQILEAQTYGQAKELARDYQKTKVMLYKRLQDLGYGSWELMQKPPEMNFFS